MARWSFLQTSFLGGRISPYAQGRMDSPGWRSSLSECKNYMPLERGELTRRPGFKWLGVTRHGGKAKLVAFDFEASQPYQIEFSAGYIRLWANEELLLTETTPPTISGITKDNPAKVILTDSAPSGWANGDTVAFTLNSYPCSAPLLCNARFRIANLGTDTFTLQDEVTGADVDGATLDYQPPVAALDTVNKIFELTTPYAEDELDDLRCVQDIDSVIVLHGDHPPYQLKKNDSGDWTFSSVTFEDGPYLDVNDTDTTLTPSGTSGSVTITASSTTGINSDAGFKSTDVGRMIRMMTGPQEWDSGTTYDKYQRVTGSDENIYWSIIHDNVGHDPTTDDGTHWNLSTHVEVRWCWLVITGFINSQSVTATVKSDKPLWGTAATSTWQLGLFSDTTSYPSCGAYHEGRLWLAGAQKNRVDGSMTNQPLVFTPTDTDGTVALDNAVAATPNGAESDVIYWMITDGQGLVCGTQGGEWVIRASTLDDPISPDSIQMRRVTTIGSANVEPAVAWSKTAFAQRHQRKVVEHGVDPWMGVNKYDAANLSRLSEDLITDGVAEIRWQQEPAMTVWVRTVTNGLVGFSYQRPSPGQQNLDGERSVIAWHRHEHGQGREFESLSVGPSKDGMSESLYAVTNNTEINASDYNVRNVEIMVPVFDAAADDCDAFHLDNAITPCCAEEMLTADGDSFDGVRQYGLQRLNGQTVTAFIGGLDLGSFTVSNGKIDVPFSGSFTQTFFENLTPCDENSGTANHRRSGTSSEANNGALIAYVGDGTTVDYDTNPGGGYLLVDHDNDKVYAVQLPALGTAGIYGFDGATDVQEAEATELDIFGDAGGGTPNHTLSNNTFYADGFIYTSVDGASNSSPIAKIDVSNMTAATVWGTSGSSLAQSDTTRIVLSFNLAAIKGQSGNRYLASCGLRSVSHINEVAILTADSNDGPAVPLIYAAQIDEPLATVCPGQSGVATPTFIVIGSSYTFDSNPIGVYEFFVHDESDAPSVHRRKICTIAPTDIDATWTNMNGMAFTNGPGYDTWDKNILIIASTTDSVTNKTYLVKIDRISGGVLWTCPLASNFGIDIRKCRIQGVLDIYEYDNSPATHQVRRIDLSDGSSTVIAWDSGLVADGMQIFSSNLGAITLCCQYSRGTGPLPTYLGEYLAGHSNTIPSNRHGRIYNDTPNKTITDSQVDFYGVVGFPYTSDAQLLRPDFQEDAGARQGPAFAKKRRIFRYSMLLHRTQNISVGTSFSQLNDAPIQVSGHGWTAATPPALFSGTVKSEINDNFSHEGQICWRQDDAYPGTVLAVGGQLESTED